MLQILLVDDEPSIRLTLGDALGDAGHAVTRAGDGGEAMAFLAARDFDAVVTDIRLPKVDGLTIFRHVRAHAPQTDVILITAYGDVGDAVEAMKAGAYDYLTKPLDNSEVVLRLARLEERRRMQIELQEARLALRQQRTTSEILGQSQAMRNLLAKIDTIADTDASVVITGESGTGKELVARALHTQSSRAGGPFVAVNCAAFPETLIEAELFGHEKGAFTGAMKRREGRFQAAHGGTLFLDEVGEIPVLMQAKLLRVLQEGKIEPLGTNAPVTVDVRLVCATHRNLKQLISEGKFREDLYYRLNVLGLHVPPLRERRQDMAILVQHFLRKFGDPAALPPALTPRAWAALANYAFPGNVRELEHAIHHAVAFSRGGEIDVQHLPEDVGGGASVPTPAQGPTLSLHEAVHGFEREYLQRTLEAVGGKRTKAAEVLGISRKNLWEKLRAHGLGSGELEG